MTSAAGYAQVERDFASTTTHDAIEGLSVEQRDRLRDYWVDRASGELTTALTFQFMLQDLAQESVPPALLALARAAIVDERRHVDWCLLWADRVDGSTPARAELAGTDPLSFDGASAHDDRLLRTVFGCCFSETVAVHVLVASHKLITLPSVRRLNQQHLREEVGHARLGWALLGWSGLSERDRGMIRSYVPEMTRITRMVWQTTRRESDDRLEQLGFLSSAIVDDASEDAIATVVLPGLEHLGIGASGERA
jgi:hypothetical protein